MRRRPRRRLQGLGFNNQILVQVQRAAAPPPLPFHVTFVVCAGCDGEGGDSASNMRFEAKWKGVTDEACGLWQAIDSSPRSATKRLSPTLATPQVARKRARTQAAQMTLLWNLSLTPSAARALVVSGC